MICLYLAISGLVLWSLVLLAPWRPWSTREYLDSSHGPVSDAGDITVLIPARNEEDTIASTLSGIERQGQSVRIILIDDQSSDNTINVAQSLGLKNLHITEGKPLPEGWSGKLWALQQGYEQVNSKFTLLLDADIELQPGILEALYRKLKDENLQMASLMVQLRMENFWEKLLMPAFIYFFKLLYPFRLANSDNGRVAAAAGGCILLETRVLNETGGFETLKGAFIDDCTLARKIKNAGHRIWIGLTHSAISLRAYNRLETIWEMVARTAFTQLHYSWLLLLVCTGLMVTAFWLPVISLFSADGITRLLGLVALLVMMLIFLPTLRFYRLSPVWTLTLPFIGTLFLAMTWSSAFRYRQGQKSVWKGRTYNR